MRSRIVICPRQIAFVPRIRRDEHRSSAFAKQTIARRAIKQRIERDLPPANCIRSECRTSDVLVPTAENDRFRFFGGALLSIRAGAWIRAPTRLAVVGGRVDTRPYEAGGRRRARGYAPLQGAAFRHVGAAYFNPPAGRPQILHSPFSIFNYTAGLGAEQLQKSKYFSKRFLKNTCFSI